MKLHTKHILYLFFFFVRFSLAPRPHLTLKFEISLKRERDCIYLNSAFVPIQGEAYLREISYNIASRSRKWRSD